MYSFYVHATTFCNMSCAHCCFDYGAGKAGRHMSIDQIKKILEIASSMNAGITLGGGEITLHPQFEEILSLCTTVYNPKESHKVWWTDEKIPLRVGFVTNGSMKDRALMMVRMTEKQLINCCLSRDQFHDPIDQEVIDAFKNANYKNYQRKFNGEGTSDRLMNFGRAKKLKGQRSPSGFLYNIYNSCLCDSIQFYPTGTVRVCACPKSTILSRNFMKECNIPEYFKEHNQCYKAYAQYLELQKIEIVEHATI